MAAALLALLQAQQVPRLRRVLQQLLQHAAPEQDLPLLGLRQGDERTRVQTPPVVLSSGPRGSGLFSGTSRR